ncbi:bifunctional metallophosphatase/5'-nucleotidase [Butyrivibrio sp. FCS006]|uniref:bifunctional metallophosphatase/5'-nucleotidase n=1 Tax=Butyrivibrio sp. FCS006 TaxID=1280684 RepID=UPI0003FF1343|nr:bifunctional UDP-sugar hydrolase/5'-nucleotidase [Butyrivibrio sp. FCS006]
MKRQRVLKSVLSVLLALAMVLATRATALTAFAYNPVAEVKTIADVPADLSGKTIILHSNDVHGAIGRYAYIASVKQNFQKRGAEVILVDSGDFSQGTSYVAQSKGADAVTSMNAAGYDIITIGNHEFDYGQTQLRANIAVGKFKTVCANILDANGNPIFDPNTMYTTKSGLKLGFFGVNTPETQTKSNPVFIKGLTFLSKGDLYACGQKQVDELKAQGADLVICLAHLGVDKEAAREGISSDIFYDHVKGIDFLFDGHSHTVMSAEGKEQMESTGTKLETIGVLVIDDATKKIENSYVLSLDGLQKEVVADAITTNIIKRINAEYDVVFAKSEVNLNGEKAPGNRTQETNMGDLVSEAMLWTVTKDAGSISVDPSHAVAITNGGGLRAPIKAGDVTKKDVNTVLPFGNTVTVVYVTGEQLLEALEASTFCTPDPVGGYPQTTGIKFTINTGKSYAAGPAYPASTYHKPASINRVTIESINDQPFSKTDTYAVVTNNFISDGGDTYYGFSQATEKFDTGIPLDEAVMAYITEELHGNIGSKYAEPRGDQTIK